MVLPAEPQTPPVSDPPEPIRAADVPLTPEQQAMLAQHYGLVQRVAEKMAEKHPVPVDDLVSAGTEGLIDAVRKFDPSRGFKFRTYATHRIRGAALDWLRSQDIVPRLERIKVAKGLIPEDAIRRTFSMDALAKEQPGHERSSAISTLLEAKPESTGGVGMDVDMVWERVERIVGRVNARILRLYFREHKNMRQIGDEFGLTESRICQSFNKALVELRKYGDFGEFTDPDHEVRPQGGKEMGEDTIYGRVEEIGPEEAKRMLGTQKRNRPVRQNKVERYAHQMRTGGWQLNGEPIIVSDQNRLIEGQHRLRAVIEYGKPVKMFVVRGVMDDASKTINTGTSRTAADVLFMFDGDGTPTDARIASTALRWLWKYRNGKTMHSGGEHGERTKTSPVKEPAPYELLELAKKEPGMREAVIWARGKSSVVPGFRDGPMAFLWHVCHGINQKDAKLFFGALVTGANLDASDPIYLLRRRLAWTLLGKGNPLGSVEYLAVCIKAWNAWRNDETPQILGWKRVEDFPRAV